MEEYDDVMETGTWLEDVKYGGNQFSRYNDVDGNSVWLCHDDCTVVESGCYKSHECS